MQITLHELARILEAEVEGDADQLVEGVSPIDNGKAGTVSFLGNPKYESQIYSTKASAVIVSNSFQSSKPLTTNLLRVENVYNALAILLQNFSKNQHPAAGISEQAFIDPSAKIGENVYVGHFTVVSAKVSVGAGSHIYPNVFLGKGVKIGANCQIYPGVRIMNHCEIGNHCVIYPNAVIGSDGFGYAPTEEGSYEAIPQVGKVILEDHVEIGANTTIDRATLGATILRKGVKLDNLIQIGHNVEIDQHTVIAALSGIAGSTKIGKYCRIGGQVGFVGHITIADKVQIQAQSGIMSSVTEENVKLFGSPTIEYMNYLKSYALFKRLPEMEKRIRQIEKELNHDPPGSKNPNI